MPEERVTDEEQHEERVDIDALQADRDQLFDRLQRLAAEFDNFRKRNAREQAAFAERANERLVKELIATRGDRGLPLEAGAVHDGAAKRPDRDSGPRGNLPVPPWS